VRGATYEDLPAIAVAACALLLELGAQPPPQARMQAQARALLEEPRAGTLLVADADSQLVGFLGVSWQSAIRIPGRYGLIQELWVHSDWRSRAIGGELLSALSELARTLGIERIEVGLPSERFARLAATESFYADNGFTTIGTRMRRLV
jgi:GNAT superfamily N-acetyltransferase